MSEGRVKPDGSGTTSRSPGHNTLLALAAAACRRQTQVPQIRSVFTVLLHLFPVKHSGDLSPHIASLLPAYYEQVASASRYRFLPRNSPSQRIAQADLHFTVGRSSSLSKRNKIGPGFQHSSENLRTSCSRELKEERERLLIRNLPNPGRVERGSKLRRLVSISCSSSGKSGPGFPYCS